VIVAFLAGALLATPVAANAAERAPCASSAWLVGEAAPVSAVGAALRMRGVQSARPVGCSPLRVAIARCDGGLKLNATGPSGGVTERVVATAETAATLIESWVRTDIAAPLLAARAVDDPPTAGLAAANIPEAVTPPPMAPPAAAATGGTDAIVRAATPAAPHASTRLAVALGADGELVHDGSHAWGASLGACLTIRVVCLGLGARLARVEAVGGEDEIARALSGTSGYGADGLVTADLLIGVGRATLRPGAALGVGWIGTRGMIVEHSADFNSVGPRAEARLALDWPVSRAVALELVLAGGAGASATIDRVANSRDRPTLVSGVSPIVRGGLGIRYGALAP